MLSRNFLIALIWPMFCNLHATEQFIRPLHVYEGLIKGVHDYFNNTCIIVLHGTPDAIESQGLEEGDDLLALQTYLSSELHIRTSIMDFEMFKNRVGLSYYHIKRPLFVLLNDHEEVKRQFAHVSTWIAMAYPTWLIFFSDDTKLDDFFLEIYVPFDCKFMVSRRRKSGGELIFEVYQVDRGKQLRSTVFGRWDDQAGFAGPKLGLFRRRSNLHGQTIRIASVHDPPLSTIRRDKRNAITGLGGFFGEVIKLLQESINCTFTYHESETWGVYLSNGTWTGTIGLLTDGKADLAATELMMTVDRIGAVDFTTPVYSTRYLDQISRLVYAYIGTILNAIPITRSRAYIKRPSFTAIKWRAYMAPFDANIWGSIGLLIVVTSATISVIKAAIAVIVSCLHDYEHAPSRFTEIVFYVFGAFCNQGMEQSSLDPVRVVHLVIHLTAVVVLAAYSAALISFLAIKTVILPFTTMEGLLKDATYRFGVIGESSDYTFFQTTADKILRIMFTELVMKEKDLPMNYLEGLTRVCEEDKYAFMTMDNMAAILRPKVNCTLETLDTITQVTIAMATSPKSPYRDIINSRILLLRDSGILQRLLKQEWLDQLKTSVNTWSSVEIVDVLPLLLFMLSGVAISCLLLIIERVIYQTKNQHKLKNKNKEKKELTMGKLANISR